MCKLDANYAEARVSPVLGKLRQEDGCKVKDSLGFI